MPITLIYIISSILGVITRFSFAPYNLFFISVINISIFFILLKKAKNIKSAFLIGFSFGFSFHLSTSYWIFYPIIDNKFFIFIIFFPILIGYFAIFSAIPAMIFKFSRTQNFFSFSFLFASFELFRATLFGGYPLYLLGYTLNAYETLMQINSIFGIFGTTFIAYMISSSLGDYIYRFLNNNDKNHVYLKTIFVTIICFIIITTQLIYRNTKDDNTNNHNTANINTDKEGLIQIIQPDGVCSISDFKCKEILFHNTISILKANRNKYTKYTILPESIIPYSAKKEDIEYIASKILKATKRTSEDPTHNLQDRYFILGALIKENNAIYTSMLLMNQNGHIIEIYKKRHLVPFGETLPIGKTLKSTLFNNLEFLSKGNKNITFNIKEDNTIIQPLICYESLFSNEININQQASFIVNISNDSWYHNSNARRHILEATRVRAIETGLPIYRSTINGISAIISPTGEIIETINQNERGVINSPILNSNSPTFYLKYKDYILKTWYIIFTIYIINNTLIYLFNIKKNRIE